MEKRKKKEKKELFVVCCRYRLIRLGGGDRGSLVTPKGGREGKVGERRGQVSEKGGEYVSGIRYR